MQACQVLTHQSQQTISVWTSLCAQDIVMLKQERAFPHCYHTIGSTELSKMSLYAVALSFPFNWN